MNNTPRVLSVGSGLLDAFLTVEDANKHFRVDGKEFCIRFGDKIQLSSTEFQLGGNACNVSVGLSRLGIYSSLMAEIGLDDFSESILAILHKENVDTSYVVRGNVPSSFAIGLNFNNERTLFVQHRLREHKFNKPDTKFDYVYLTSMGKEWNCAYKTVVDYVDENKIPLLFNPGTPQISEGKESILEPLSSAYILFINRSEASLITDKDETIEIDGLLKAVSDLGPKIVSITDGRNGSYVMDETGKMYHAGIYDGKVVERTGAGDAYATGFVGGIVMGKSIKECMEWGSMNASSVVEKVGAETGLLTMDQLRNRVESSEKLSIREI